MGQIDFKDFSNKSQIEPKCIYEIVKRSSDDIGLKDEPRRSLDHKIREIVRVIISVIEHQTSINKGQFVLLPEGGTVLRKALVLETDIDTSENATVIVNNLRKALLACEGLAQRRVQFLDSEMTVSANDQKHLIFQDTEGIDNSSAWSLGGN